MGSRRRTGRLALLALGMGLILFPAASGAKAQVRASAASRALPALFRADWSHGLAGWRESGSGFSTSRGRLTFDGRSRGELIAPFSSAHLPEPLAPGVAAAQSSTGAAPKRLATQPVASTSLNIHNMPVENAASLSGSGSAHTMPLLSIRGGKTSSQSGQAPASNPVSSPSPNHGAPGFDGMADSPTICPYFGGCQPPDMALGVSPTYVFQGVNTSWALYTRSGSIVAGPINSQNFFGVPNPTRSGCDPGGPFLSDPRAFYDPNDGLFWAATLQIEDALGIGTKCTFQSAIWVANFNPTTGVIHSYRFDTSLGQGFANDYTQFGFNARTVAISMNLFNAAGTAFFGAEAQFLNKQAMENGAPVTPVAFYGFTAGGVLLDDFQPVETETPSASDPGVLYLVSSFNSPDASGNDCITVACHGFVVGAYDASTSSFTQTIVDAPTLQYISPPNADQPGCNQCIETIDNRITGTPVYSITGKIGLISFAHGTGVNNGTQEVSGVQWGQIQPTLSGSSLVGAALYQGGDLAFAGDQAASFGAVMTDAKGNLTMVLDSMGHALNPSIMVATRAFHDPLGTLGTPTMLKQGLTATGDSRWGDFEATSYDGFSTNHVWVASQYSGSNTDWSTFIAQP
jgi:hypothetical protein